MATNKHAVIRYRVIDKCLRQVDLAWNWKSLAEACAKEIEKVTGKPTTLSERTIKGDLKSMRSDTALGYFAPIEYDRAEKSYYYSRRNFSITEAPLSRSDSEELQNAINLLRQFTGFQHLEGIDNIIKKLELLAFESITKAKPIVHLAQPPSVPGQKWLDTLYDAIKKEKAISIEYQPFGKQSKNVIVSPYLLKEYDNRWYLFGIDHEKEALRTYGLERINAIKPTLQEYLSTDGFDPDKYFNDIIGITFKASMKVQTVKFKVFGTTLNYIRTKPLHHSQQEIDTGVFSVSLVPNFELESLLLSFGENMEVISPKALRNKLAKRVLKMNHVYQ